MNGAKCVVHTIEAGCNVFICYNFIILNTETVKMNFKEHKKTSKTMPVDTQHTTLDACSNHVCTLALFPRYLHTSLSFNLVTTTNIQSQIFSVITKTSLKCYQLTLSFKNVTREKILFATDSSTYAYNLAYTLVESFHFLRSVLVHLTADMQYQLDTLHPRENNY